MSNSRAIRLTRLHAINWYGYQDTLPVAGNLVLAGVTGSGKSILMDLLMLVLVGPEKARHHFNRSATGGQSDRTIKGYCLLDTKREENGQPQYFHDKGVITYIAAEFTWPDGVQVETWGLRFEFRNTAENDGHPTPFFCQGALEKSDFVQTDAADGKRRPLDLASFRTLIGSRKGRIFPSSREYVRDMANSTHLNFNRDVLDRLLPSAMSFTNLKSFDDFCRKFVLPDEAVPVDDVINSYKDFLAYERDLKELRDQLTRLTTIRLLSQQRVDAVRDRDVARYLAAELAHEHAQVLMHSGEQQLAKKRELFAEDDRRLKELADLIENTSRERERVMASLNETSEGKIYHERSQRVESLEVEIERLRELSMKLSDRLRKRVADARAWLKEVQRAPIAKPVDTRGFESALELLNEGEREEMGVALNHLRDAAGDICRALRSSIADEMKDLSRLRDEGKSLSEQINQLRAGLPPVKQPLLDELNQQLLSVQGHKPARALHELCEVMDEDWRAAVEVVFTDKFAVIVGEDQHAEALRVLHELKGDTHGTLIDPKRMLALKAKATKGSLAEKIETSNSIARACVDAWFGNVLCVPTLAELAKHEAAVLPDGLLQRDGMTRRERHYDGLPFVGKRGLQKQLQIKRTSLVEVQTAMQRLEPIESAVNAIIADKDAKVPEPATLRDDLVRLESLPQKELEHEDLMKRLAEIDQGSFREMENQVQDLKAVLTDYGKEQIEIAGKGLRREIEQLEKQLHWCVEQASKREDEFLKASRQMDISAHLERMKSWKAEMLQSFPSEDAAASQFKDEANAAAVLAERHEGNLKTAMVSFKQTFSPRFNDLPEDGRSTHDYDKLLARIEDQGIPDFQKKAGDERKRWESLFRTQVLSRMQKALKDIDNIIFLLNQQLRRPIGNDVYHIKKDPSPEFKFYRELINLNSTRDPDDLFFHSLEGELRTALDHFLQTLVKQASSPEAMRLLDYRQYFDYDLLVYNKRDPDAKPVSVDKQGGKSSGGENQSPYFVAILASYLHAYNRHEKRWKQPSLALVPIDEAFSKLSGERIQDCMNAMVELELQGVLSMSSGNIPYAFSLCDELIVVAKREKREGGKYRIRNVPTVFLRDTPEGQEWMANHGA